MAIRPTDFNAPVGASLINAPEIQPADELPDDATVVFERNDSELKILFKSYSRHRYNYSGPSGTAVPRGISGMVAFNGGLAIIYDRVVQTTETLLDRQIARLVGKISHKPQAGKTIARIYLTGPLSKLTGRKLGGEALFGKSEVSEYDVAAFVMKGLPTGAVDTLQFWARLSDSEVDQLVIPRRTLRHRREKDQSLSKEESDRAARIARVVSHAEQVFEDPAKADRWLRRELKSLNGQQPLIMAETEAGARVVEELLEKIAWGAAA